MTLQIGKAFYSDYRVKKMLTGSKESATKLRGWDRFCEKFGLERIGLGNCSKKRRELNSLYDSLYANTIKTEQGNEVQNSNVNRFIIFNNLSRLVNKGSQLDDKSRIKFSLHINSSEIGLTKNVEFKINGHLILTKPCNPLEEKLINHFKKMNYINKESCIIQDSFSLTYDDFKKEFYSTSPVSIFPMGLNNYGNDCFINSSLQFILNNSFLINACLSHQDKEFRDTFILFVNGNNSTHLKLIRLIRQKFTNAGKFGQDSAPMLLQNIFNHNHNILSITCPNLQSLGEINYNVFEELHSYTDERNLLDIIQNIPKKQIENLVQCEPYNDLKYFVLNHEDLKIEFGNLFTDMNYTEFLDNIKSKQDMLLSLEKLIAHPDFKKKLSGKSEFQWVDTSGYGFSYTNGIANKENTLEFKQIPNNSHLNSIIVHSGNDRSGHYVCYVKKGADWFLCNDSRIEKLENIENHISGKNIVAFSHNKNDHEDYEIQNQKAIEQDTKRATPTLQDPKHYQKPFFSPQNTLSDYDNKEELKQVSNFDEETEKEFAKLEQESIQNQKARVYYT